jgi:hypothetical protein
MAGKVLGRAIITANGRRIESNKGAKLMVGGVKRSSVMTAHGRAGNQQEQTAGRVEGSFPLKAGIKVKELQALEDITVLFQADTGQLYTVAHADWMDPPEMDDQSGNVPFAFEGEEAQEA